MIYTTIISANPFSKSVEDSISLTIQKRFLDVCPELFLPEALVICFQQGLSQICDQRVFDHHEFKEIPEDKIYISEDKIQGNRIFIKVEILDEFSIHPLVLCADEHELGLRAFISQIILNIDSFRKDVQTICSTIRIIVSDLRIRRE